VFLAKFCNALVAAKTLHMLMNPDQYGLTLQEVSHQVKELENELEIQSQVRHPNLLHFEGAVYKRNNQLLYILSEYASGGSLQKTLDTLQKENKFLPKNLIVSYSTDILQGLSY